MVGTLRDLHMGHPAHLALDQTNFVWSSTTVVGVDAFSKARVLLIVREAARPLVQTRTGTVRNVRELDPVSTSSASQPLCPGPAMAANAVGYWQQCLVGHSSCSPGVRSAEGQVVLRIIHIPRPGCSPCSGGTLHLGAQW